MLKDKTRYSVSDSQESESSQHWLKWPRRPCRSRTDTHHARTRTSIWKITQNQSALLPSLTPISTSVSTPLLSFSSAFSAKPVPKKAISQRQSTLCPRKGLEELREPKTRYTQPFQTPTETKGSLTHSPSLIFCPLLYWLTFPLLFTFSALLPSFSEPDIGKEWHLFLSSRH